MSKELQITMFGHTRVGKTSILAAMYDQLVGTFPSEINLQIRTESETAKILQNRVNELKNLSKAIMDESEITTIIGSSQPKKYKFDLCKIGAEKASLTLSFHDYPGGYLDRKDDTFIRNIMNNSFAVILAIDAPALMEQKGKYHVDRNTPTQILNYFQKLCTVDNLNQTPKLVILAPVRCEGYVKSQADADKLLNAIEKAYKPLLNLFSSSNMRDKITCVVTPVQTVGNVEFNDIKLNSVKIEKDGTVQKIEVPNFRFSSIPGNQEYSPKDCDQPLRYILKFAVNLHIKKRWFLKKFIAWVIRWDNDLKESAEKAAQKCKTTNGFKILQDTNKLFG